MLVLILQYVKIFVREVSTENTYDTLSIHDGPDDTYTLLRKLSGTRRSVQLTATFPSVSIYFESDYDTVGFGFLLTYHFEGEI